MSDGLRLDFVDLKTLSSLILEMSYVRKIFLKVGLLLDFKIWLGF